VSSPSGLRCELWRRLAQDQDASRWPVERQLREVGRAVASRLSVLERGGAGASVSVREGASTFRRGQLLMLGGGVAVVVVAMVWLAAALASRSSSGLVARRHVRTTTPVSEGAHQASSGGFVVDARGDLPLQFGDGSTVTFGSGSTGRLQRLDGTRAEIVLERGWLDAHVIHADTTVWLLHAGPYCVHVTGTRFTMKWTAQNLEVDLFEGAVVIDGSILGAGLPLKAGNRLKITSGSVLIEPIGVEPSMVTRGNSEQARGQGQRQGQRQAQGQAQGGDRWMALAERGAYREALAAATQLGWNHLCHHLDARRLLTLGDVARYSDAAPRARQAFQFLVTRFPRDRLAADAVFSLGRLAFESHHPDEASRWFRRYLTDWPSAPLADQAAGRVLECAIRSDDQRAAEEAARSYLARVPGGPHALLARQVLGQPVDDGRP